MSIISRIKNRMASNCLEESLARMQPNAARWHADYSGIIADRDARRAQTEDRFEEELDHLRELVEDSKGGSPTDEFLASIYENIRLANISRRSELAFIEKDTELALEELQCHVKDQLWTERIRLADN